MVGVGRHGVPLDEYQVELCDCCHNASNCCLGFFCPCVLGCKAAKKLDESTCYPNCFGMYGLQVRFRTLVGIKDDMFNEACTWLCCRVCSAIVSVTFDPFPTQFFHESSHLFSVLSMKWRNVTLICTDVDE